MISGWSMIAIILIGCEHRGHERGYVASLIMLRVVE